MSFFHLPLKEIVSTEFLYIDLQSVRRFAAAAVSRTNAFSDA
jgi:hypothetical protein